MPLHSLNQIKQRAIQTSTIIASDTFGIALDDVQSTPVPLQKVTDPKTGLTQTYPWEPEDGVLFESTHGLYSFPGMMTNVPNMIIIPNLGLDFQTVTLAFVPKDSDSMLNQFMQRVRFDIWERADPEQASLFENQRIPTNAVYGLKDAGKDPSRMECETGNLGTDLRKSNGLNALKNKHAQTFLNRGIYNLISPSAIGVGATTALTRTCFVGLNHIQEFNALVYQRFSIDFCINTTPSIEPVGVRFEGEGEAYFILSPEPLNDTQAKDVINMSIDGIWSNIRQQAAASDIKLIETDKNKAEYARAQVEDCCGIENALAEGIKPSQYGKQPLLRRLNSLFDAHVESEKLIMPSPEEMRRYSNIELDENTLEVA